LFKIIITKIIPIYLIKKLIIYLIFKIKKNVGFELNRKYFEKYYIFLYI